MSLSVQSTSIKSIYPLKYTISINWRTSTSKNSMTDLRLSSHNISLCYETSMFLLSSLLAYSFLLYVVYFMLASLHAYYTRQACLDFLCLCGCGHVQGLKLVDCFYCLSYIRYVYILQLPQDTQDLIRSVNSSLNGKVDALRSDVESNFSRINDGSFLIGTNFSSTLSGINAFETCETRIEETCNITSPMNGIYPTPCTTPEIASYLVSCHTE